MRRFRVSILGLMVLVAFVAVGAAALLTASEWWAASLFTATLALLGIALLGVIYRRGERQAFWLGFALFGWGYVLACFAPGLGSSVGSKLVTTRMLEEVYTALVRRNGPYSWVDDVTPVIGAPAAADFDGDGVIDTVWPSFVGVDGSGNWANPGGRYALGNLTITGRLRNRPLLAEAFFRIGHCLLAVVFATLGGLLARRFQATCCEASVAGDRRASTGEETA